MMSIFKCAQKYTKIILYTLPVINKFRNFEPGVKKNKNKKKKPTLL